MATPEKTGTERIPASDIGSAVKAKVEKLREAQAQVDAKVRELEVDRRKLEQDRREFGKMEEALENLKGELDGRDDNLKAREGELAKGQRALKEAEQKLSEEDHRLKEWAKTLQNTEKEVRSLQDRSNTDREEIASKLQEVNNKVSGLVERDELIASREAALAESVERLTKIGESIAAREKALAGQQEELIKLQNERTASLRKREEDATALMESLTRRLRDQEAAAATLAAMENALKGELDKIASERTRLAGKERNIIEVERSLSSVLESEGIAWEPAANPAPPNPQRGREPPSPPRGMPERPPAPEPARAAPPPPPPRQRETMDQEFERVVAQSSAKVSKSDAIEKMNRALEVAKSARDQGLDVTEVRKILKAARAAFEGQNWEDAVRLSDRILEMLPSAAAPGR